MRYALLERRDKSDEGCFGIIVARRFVAYTGELPWLNNQPNVSCVPGDGAKYKVVWTYSPHFRRYMYLLLGTEPRAGIREHSANLMGNKLKGYRAQLNGCIALGERLGWLDGQKAVLLSRPAVRRFEEYMEHEPFILEIR